MIVRNNEDLMYNQADLHIIIKELHYQSELYAVRPIKLRIENNIIPQQRALQ